MNYERQKNISISQPLAQASQGAGVCAINPNGWPRVFIAEFSYHAKCGDEPAFVTFEGLSAGGESVTNWANENLLLDESALEEEALSRVPPHISGDFS